MENKLGKIKTVEEAMKYINDGCTVMMAGFGAIGTSYVLCQAIYEKNVQDMTVISLDAGDVGVGLDNLVCNRQCRKLITSHIGFTKGCVDLYNAGELEVEFSPQGTLAERVRAGGSGLGGFLTEVGLNTIIEEGKRKITVDEKEYILEKPLTADVAIILAEKADEYGNLVYSKTARGMNPVMAKAAKTTIAAAKEIVAAGSIDPEEVVTPGAYVDIIVQERGEWNWPWM